MSNAETLLFNAGCIFGAMTVSVILVLIVFDCLCVRRRRKKMEEFNRMVDAIREG